MDVDTIPARHRRKQRKTIPESADPPVPDETSKQFSKRELSSNWNKYDDNLSSNDIDVPNSSNFEELLSAPVSFGGHFLFNSEKSWEASDDWYNRDEYFQLNLAELSKSLATIPFYQRQNYSKEIFSSEEIDRQNRQAKYQLFKWSANSTNTAVKLSDESATAKNENKETQNVANLPQNDEDDLDDLLNLTGPKRHEIQSSALPPTTNPSSGVTIQLGRTAEATDDIQKWLDDILVLDS